MPTCPKSVESRGKILWYNGFGYQSPNEGVDDKWIICFCKELNDQQVKQLQELSGSRSVRSNEWLGKGYIEIQWDEYAKIKPVFDALLILGIPFTTQNKLSAYFDTNDKEFTDELAELKCIKRLRDYLKNKWGDIHDTYIFKDVFFDYWNYKSDAGKQFCNEIRALKRLPTMNDELAKADKENYYNWQTFQNYDPVTLMDRVGSSPPSLQNKTPKKGAMGELGFPNKSLKRKFEEIEEKNDCMICFENQPQTLVLPCGHSVVCKNCSHGLKRTADAKICVRCRNPIKEILEDE